MKPETMKILTVDDTPANIRLLTHYLEKQGYQVLTAEDGFEGFKSAIQHCPDLILLDVMMPGTDGYEVCELLKAEEATKDIPVMFLTAKTDVEDKIRGFELGAVDYITKPFNLTEISTRVENQLKKKHIERQNSRYRHLFQRISKLTNLGKLGEVLCEELMDELNQVCDGLESSDGGDTLKGLLKKLQTYNDIASREKPVRAAVNLIEILETVAGDIRDVTDGGVDFYLELPEEAVSIVGDNGELYQAFWNLFYAAYESSPSGISVPVIVSSEVLPEVLKEQLISSPASSYIMVSIEDSSEDPVLSPETFINPLMSENSQASLLRYAATASIIHDHEGVLQMVPGEKSGRRMVIYLPG